MEALTRLVSESLARHGFDRPPDYRRLHWSRWFRCESPHSLLFVPSKPGVFAVAEEIMNLAATSAQVATGGPAWTAEAEGRKPEAGSSRMLAVTQFFEDDDMAFVLDRMLSRENPMRARLVSGRYFVRFVVIEDQSQRHSICGALNQWMLSSAEKANGIGSHFASSLELTPATEYVPQANDAQQCLFESTTGSDDEASVGRAVLPAPVGSINTQVETGPSPVPPDPALSLSKGRSAAAPESVRSAGTLNCTAAAPHLDSGAGTNIHCPSPFPSGF
jgi:hypothetical protein